MRRPESVTVQCPQCADALDYPPVFSIQHSLAPPLLRLLPSFCHGIKGTKDDHLILTTSRIQRGASSRRHTWHIPGTARCQAAPLAVLPSVPARGICGAARYHRVAMPSNSPITASTGLSAIIPNTRCRVPAQAGSCCRKRCTAGKLWPTSNQQDTPPMCCCSQRPNRPSSATATTSASPHSMPTRAKRLTGRGQVVYTQAYLPRANANCRLSDRTNASP